MKLRKDMNAIITNVEYVHDIETDEIIVTFITIEIGGLRLSLNYEVDRYLEKSDYNQILNLVEDEIIAMSEYDVYILDYSKDDIITFRTLNDCTAVEALQIVDNREDEEESLEDYCKRGLKTFVEVEDYSNLFSDREELDIDSIKLLKSLKFDSQRYKDKEDLKKNRFNDIENKLNAVTKVRNKFDNKLIEFTAGEIYKALIKTVNKYN